MPFSEQADYNKAVIYTITNVDNPTLVYVGSTTNLANRYANHLYHYKFNFTKHLYKVVRETGGWDKWKCDIHKVFPCQNLSELFKEEDNCRVALQATLNMKKAVKSPTDRQDYRNQNREILRQKQRTYYLENKAIVKSKQSEKIECTCGAFIQRSNIAKHRQTHQKM